MTATSDSSAPTAPRKMSPDGLELDEWDLPLAGPARAAELERLGKPDPNVSPKAWKGWKAAAVNTETNNG